MATPMLTVDEPRGAGDQGSARALLRRAAEALQAAAVARSPDERFAAAHLAALRAAAALVAARGRPPSLRRRLVNVWVVLRRVAPECAAEAAYFAAGAKARVAIEAGAYGVVSARTADDQLRAAANFVELVERRVRDPAPALAG